MDDSKLDEEMKKWEKVQEEHWGCRTRYKCKDSIGLSNIWEGVDEGLKDYSKEEVQEIRSISRDYWFYESSWNRHPWQGSYYSVPEVEGLINKMAKYDKFFELQIKCLKRELDLVHGDGG